MILSAGKLERAVGSRTHASNLGRSRSAVELRPHRGKPSFDPQRINQNPKSELTVPGETGCCELVNGAEAALCAQKRGRFSCAPFPCRDSLRGYMISIIISAPLRRRSKTLPKMPDRR